MVQQPVLHVEARVKSIGDGIIVRTDLVETPPLASRNGLTKLRRRQIRDDVTRWLIDNFVVLSLGQEIHSFGNGCSKGYLAVLV